MKTLPNVLALILLFVLNACALPVGTDSDLDMNHPTHEQIEKMRAGDESYRWGTRPENWGQGRQFTPGQLAVDGPAALGNVDAPKIWRVPHVQNIALYAEPTYRTSNNFLLHWVLQAGIGGASSRIEFDAGRFQQVAISAATVNVALVVRALDPASPVDISDLNLNAGYYQADGNTSTNLARLTAFFRSPAAGEVFVPVPAGASAWQVFGDTTQVNAITTAYQVSAGAAVFDGYRGDALLAGHAAGDFIPLVGVPTNIAIINNAASDITGFISFQLEL